MEFAESKQSMGPSPEPEASKLFQRRQNFALRCSSQAMQLIRERLDLDIVELWKFDGKEYECLFIHATDSIVRDRDDVISSNNYFPNNGSAATHKYSPRVCDRVRESRAGYYWDTVDSPAESGLASVVHDEPERYSSVMGFTFKHDAAAAGDGGSDVADSKEQKEEARSVPSYQELFIVGFSSKFIQFSLTKFYFISGLCYAIMAVFRDIAEYEAIGCSDVKEESLRDFNGAELIMSNISMASIQSADLNSEPSSFLQRGLGATHSTMQLIAATLMLDVVQLWKADPDGSDHVCVYAYVADSTLRWDPDVTYTYNYYPSDGRKDKKAPKLCQLSKESTSRVHWHVYPLDLDRKTPLHYRTELAYYLNCREGEDKETSDIFIVGLSRMKVQRHKMALKVLSGLSYSVYIAAHDVLRPEPRRIAVNNGSKSAPALYPAPADLISRPSSLDRDDPHLATHMRHHGLVKHSGSVSASDQLKPFAEMDDSDFVYPIANIPAENHAISIDEIRSMRHLSDGCHSNVYSGFLGSERVAIKFIREDCLDDPVAVREFVTEGDILCRVSHPNVIRLYGGGSVPRRFLVYEWMEGGILSSILLPNKMRPKAIKMFHKYTFSFSKVIAKALEFAEAMKYLHFDVYEDATIIHRDLKPDNIGFDAEGVLKIIDFGMATCVKRRQHTTETYEMSGNTGSLRYMAPEVATNRPYTEKVDVYSFGLIVWQMATDMIPFSGLRTSDFMEVVVTNNERPKVDHKHWPSAFCDLLQSCWDSDFSKRPSFIDIIPVLLHLQGRSNDDKPAQLSPSPLFNSMRKRAGSFFE